MEKATLPGSATTKKIANEYENLRAASSAIQQIRISAQRELDLARKMRAEAQQYQKATEMKARSEAQQLILRTRLSTQKEVEELIRKAGDEIQKVLADIRVIRITAQEELAAQRKFTDAAKLATLSFALDNDKRKQANNKEKEPAAKD